MYNQYYMCVNVYTLRISRNLKSLVVWRSKKTLQKTESTPSFLEGPMILRVHIYIYMYHIYIYVRTYYTISYILVGCENPPSFPVSSQGLDWFRSFKFPNSKSWWILLLLGVRRIPSVLFQTNFWYFGAPKKGETMEVNKPHFKSNIFWKRRNLTLNLEVAESEKKIPF